MKEYKTIRAELFPAGAADDVLNEHAAEGWELRGMQQSMHHNVCMFVLEREATKAVAPDGPGDQPVDAGAVSDLGAESVATDGFTKDVDPLTTPAGMFGLGDATAPLSKRAQKRAARGGS